ncbi:MAG: T9SS type A sorting domain-containing protein [FCB group bacterium]|nr:T9SS type A sorting domain-containing protein [FCB group bacterium]
MLKDGKLILIFLSLTILVSNLFSVYHRIGGIDIDPSISHNTIQMEVDQYIAYCLVAQELQIYNIQDLSNPELISELNIIGSPKHFVINDNFLFISTYVGGYEVGCFIIADISDINNPIIIYEYYTYSNNGYYYPNKAEIINGYAYVDYYDPITWQSKFLIFDISDPLNTTLLSTFSHSMEVIDFDIVNNICYLFGWGQGDCIVLDISDPLNPFILTTYSNLESFYAVEIVENLAYCCSGIDFRIYDFSDPYNIYLISELDGIFNSKSIYIDQNRVFIAAGSDGLLVIDVSDINNPCLIDVYDSNNSPNESATYVIVSDNIAYLTDTSSNGFLFIDVSDNNNINLIENFDGYYSNNSVSISGNLLVTVEHTGQDSIYFYDITNPSNPILLYSHCPFPGLYLRTLRTNDQYAFVCFQVGVDIMLAIYDISDPQNIYQTGECVIEYSSFIYDIVQKDSYLLIGGNHGLLVYELDNNGNPTFNSNFSDFVSSIIDINDDIACIFHSDGLAFLDVSTNPINPTLLSVWPTPDYVRSINIEENIVFLLIKDIGVYIVDISDIYSPILLSTISTHIYPEISQNLVVKNNTLTISDLNWNELLIYDITDLSNPVIEKALNWNLKSVDFDVIGNYIISSNKAYGLSYLDTNYFTIIENYLTPNLNNFLTNYPNPFNPTTTIEFSIQNDSNIELSIYNIKGQKIKSLLKDQITAGEHSIVWNGKDDAGKQVSSGVYFYKLKVNDKTELVKKCLLLK